MVRATCALVRTVGTGDDHWSVCVVVVHTSTIHKHASRPRHCVHWQMTLLFVKHALPMQMQCSVSLSMCTQQLEDIVHSDHQPSTLVQTLPTLPTPHPPCARETDAPFCPTDWFIVRHRNGTCRCWTNSPSGGAQVSSNMYILILRSGALESRCAAVDIRRGVNVALCG